MLNPVPSACPPGSVYRKPYYVPGSCISDKKGSSRGQTDPRCPQGMRWRKTFEVKGNCVRQNTNQRLKKNIVDTPAPALPDCDRNAVSPVFTDHLKLINSTINEYFKVPDTRVYNKEKEFTTFQDLYTKIKKRFLLSINKKFKDRNCEYRPLPEDLYIVDSEIKYAIYAYYSSLLTPEEWDLVARSAEITLLLYISRKSAFGPFIYNYTLTVHYNNKIHELHELLIYMDKHNLLPHQNMAIALAFYNYLNDFYSVDNIHQVAGVNPPVSSEIRAANQTKLLNKAVLEGYLEDRSLTVQKARTLDINIPKFQPVLSNIVVEYDEAGLPIRTLETNSMLSLAVPPSFEVPEEAPPPAAIPEPENVLQPSAKLLARPSVLSRSSSSRLQAEALTPEDLQELYELYFIFETYNKKRKAELNGRGRQLLERYKYLFHQLELYHNSQLNEQQLLEYIQNYGESQLEPTSIPSLVLKYRGPFWNEVDVTVHCPHCNNPISISNYVAGTVVPCPVCGKNIKLN